ncbi:T9SS type A sorting domain-containing protein [Fluviicola sp.]|uniref:T9SS type A sorting domain-containing protein n=1 Tax=Fluviicola sp. TaxID=1917219 RepID=UPI0031DF56F1
MKKSSFITALLVCVAGLLRAQTTVSGSFVHGGITRTYSFYIPAMYNPANPVPLVFNLHGLGTDGAYQAQYRDFRPIADTANFIVVHPDGSTMFGQRFWNYGSVLGSTVDDVGFLEALIDTISADYSINSSRVYCAGMSNGSFMAYYLACQSNRFAAIGTVTGSMSVDMYDECVPQHPVPVLHIHGTSDNTNPYAGTSTMKGIDDTNLFWVDQNNCNPVPAVIPIPDAVTSDNATATRYLYTGGTNGYTVELFKVTGGGHTWPGSPVSGSSGNTCMDFDASKEIWRFFSQYEGTAAVSDYKQVDVAFWPNPAEDAIIIQASNNRPVKEITVRDMRGRLVEKKTGENIQSLDIDHLKAGTYILKISGKGFTVSKKLVITNS